MNRGTQCDYTVVTAGTDRLLYTWDYACIVKLCKLKSDHPSNGEQQMIHYND